MRRIMVIEGVASSVIAGVGSVMAIFTATGAAVAFIGLAGMFIHATYLMLGEL